jgi:hypothetical protein
MQLAKGTQHLGPEPQTAGAPGMIPAGAADPAWMKPPPERFPVGLRPTDLIGWESRDPPILLPSAGRVDPGVSPGQRFALSRPWNHVVSCEEQSDEAIATSESISGEALIFGH